MDASRKEYIPPLPLAGIHCKMNRIDAVCKLWPFTDRDGTCRNRSFHSPEDPTLEPGKDQGHCRWSSVSKPREESLLQSFRPHLAGRVRVSRRVIAHVTVGMKRPRLFSSPSFFRYGIKNEKGYSNIPLTLLEWFRTRSRSLPGLYWFLLVHCSIGDFIHLS